MCQGGLGHGGTVGQKANEEKAGELSNVSPDLTKVGIPPPLVVLPSFARVRTLKHQVFLFYYFFLFICLLIYLFIYVFFLGFFEGLFCWDDGMDGAGGMTQSP